MSDTFDHYGDALERHMNGEGDGPDEDELLEEEEEDIVEYRDDDNYDFEDDDEYDDEDFDV